MEVKSGKEFYYFQELSAAVIMGVGWVIFT